MKIEKVETPRINTLYFYGTKKETMHDGEVLEVNCREKYDCYEVGFSEWTGEEDLTLWARNFAEALIMAELMERLRPDLGDMMGVNLA